MISMVINRASTAGGKVREDILEERALKPCIKRIRVRMYPQLTHLLCWIIWEAELNVISKNIIWILTVNMLNERNRIQRSLFSMMPFVQNSKTGKSNL